MPFIGQEPLTGAYHVLDSITASATATYNLQLNGGAFSPATANQLIVSLNGVIQKPGSSFNISGSQITFSSALTPSDSIDFIMALGDVLNVGTPTDGSVNAGKIASGAVTSAKLDTNIAVSGNFDVGTIRSTGGTTAMTIDSGGRVLTPQRPLFKAGLTTTRTAASAGTYEAIVWTNEVFDIGGNWDNTEFIAPIAGLYYFYFTILTPNDTAQHNFQIRQDTGSGYSPQLYARAARGNSPNEHETVAGSTILNLSVGHKVSFFYDRVTYGDGSTYWSSCGGYLIG